MAGNLLDFVLKFTKQGNGDAQAVSSMKNLAKGADEVLRGLTGFGLAGLSASGAILAVAGGLKDSAEKFVAYGKSMSEMAAITGTGVEATSRMVQTLDDFGVSQDKVNTILQQAAKQGFTMTIDNLANLADEYNSLETQEEKNALMTERLGRAGLDLNKVMEAGSDAIRDAAAAQADGLVLTQQEADQAEALRKNIDTLNDTWEALALTVGGTVAGALNSVIEKQGQYQALIASGTTIKELNNMTTAQKDAAIAAMELADSQEWVASHSREAMEMIKGGNSAIAEIPVVIDPAIAAQEELNTVLKAYSDQLLFTIASQGLTADEALKLAGSMGLVDANTQMAYDKTAEFKSMLDAGTITVAQYNQLILDMQHYLNQLQDKEITLTLNTNYAGSGSRNPELDLGGGGPSREEYATGTPGWVTVPPGHPNDSYLVGLTSGEVFNVKNARQQSDGGDGMTVNFNGPIMVDNEANYQKTLRRLSQDLTAQMRG